jgi:hypothetical protein
MKVNDCFGSYFLITMLIVFFMLLYVFFAPIQPIIIDQRVYPFEMFDNKEITLLPKDKILVIQGNGIPDQNFTPTENDKNDPAYLSVDGTDKSPSSLFAFAYNKCSPECCGDSGGYSCNGGCVCITNEQKKFFGSRANNNIYNKCSNDEY